MPLKPLPDRLDDFTEADVPPRMRPNSAFPDAVSPVILPASLLTPIPVSPFPVAVADFTEALSPVTWMPRPLLDDAVDDEIDDWSPAKSNPLRCGGDNVRDRQPLSGTDRSDAGLEARTTPFSTLALSKPPELSTP